MFVLPSGCTSFYVLHAGLSFSGGAFLPLLHCRPPFCTLALHFAFTLRRGFSPPFHLRPAFLHAGFALHLPSPAGLFSLSFTTDPLFARRLCTSPSLSGGAFLPLLHYRPPFCTPALHFAFPLRQCFCSSPSLPSPFLHAGFALHLPSPAGLFSLSFTAVPLFALRFCTSSSLSGGAFLPLLHCRPPFCTPTLLSAFFLRRGFSSHPSLPSPFLHASFALRLPSPAGLFFLSFTSAPLFCTPA